MWPTSYVRKSGQGWKLAIGAVLLVGGGVVVFISASGHADTLEPGTFIAILLTGLFLSFGGGLAWPAYSIRCRSCGLKLLWHALAARPHQDSIEWFLLVDACPSCGATR